jgi:hypothetical protein
MYLTWSFYIYNYSRLFLSPRKSKQEDDHLILTFPKIGHRQQVEFQWRHSNQPLPPKAHQGKLLMSIMNIGSVLTFSLYFCRMQIRVLGVPQTGAKSRVETQIKLCIQLVTDDGNKAQQWSHLKLSEKMVTKAKIQQQQRQWQQQRHKEDQSIDIKKVLFLHARVLCASDPSRAVTTCLGCVQREVSYRSSLHYSYLTFDDFFDFFSANDLNVANRARNLNLILPPMTISDFCYSIVPN